LSYPIAIRLNLSADGKFGFAAAIKPEHDDFTAEPDFRIHG